MGDITISGRFWDNVNGQGPGLSTVAQPSYMYTKSIVNSNFGLSQLGVPIVQCLKIMILAEAYD